MFIKYSSCYLSLLQNQAKGETNKLFQMSSYILTHHICQYYKGKIFGFLKLVITDLYVMFVQKGPQPFLCSSPCSV